MDWIFAFRIESVGLVVHFGAYISGGRLQAVLDILEVNGTVSGQKNILRNRVKMIDNVKQHNIQSHGTKNIRYDLF